MKAKYLRTDYIKYGGKYQVFEYRGKEYGVSYDRYGHYNGIYHDIKGEHSANQNEIDKVLDNKLVATEDAEKGFELFYKYCEED